MIFQKNKTITVYTGLFSFIDGLFAYRIVQCIYTQFPVYGCSLIGISRILRTGQEV